MSFSASTAQSVPYQPGPIPHQSRSVMVREMSRRPRCLIAPSWQREVRADDWVIVRVKHGGVVIVDLHLSLKPSCCCCSAPFTRKPRRHPYGCSVGRDVNFGMPS